MAVRSTSSAPSRSSRQATVLFSPVCWSPVEVPGGHAMSFSSVLTAVAPWWETAVLMGLSNHSGAAAPSVPAEDKGHVSPRVSGVAVPSPGLTDLGRLVEGPKPGELGRVVCWVGREAGCGSAPVSTEQATKPVPSSGLVGPAGPTELELGAPVPIVATTVLGAVSGRHDVVGRQVGAVGGRSDATAPGTGPYIGWMWIPRGATSLRVSGPSL